MAKKKTLKDYSALGSISAELVLKNLTFVFFLGFLTIVYIANSLYAEKKVRQILELQSEVKELKREYNSLQAEIMFNSRFSEVSKKVESMGLRRTGQQPNKILVDPAE
ncbi:MAG: hypothetical protein KDC44_11255 [Phaeodactylibacter sp.]|nr:hypothetical protein [Phaeodactylibacter sp.]